MSDTAATVRLSSLEAAILRTVVYSDLFDFPLTPEEVWRRLPAPARRDEVEAVLATDAPMGLLEFYAPYVTLSARGHIIELRERRRRSSDALRATATHYGRLIARLPFVRMVAITGSLAADNAEDGDDLDYLIVTAPGRVWFARALTMLVVRFAALRGLMLCPNYLLDENVLALPDRDLYTARELRQMRPVGGHDVYARMLAANAWWHDYLPNAEEPVIEPRVPRRSLLRRAIEALLSLPPFDRLEAWLLARKGAKLRRDAGPEAVFDATMCKGHFEGWRERTHRQVEQRVAALLERPS